jgi:hypothetical protein
LPRYDANVLSGEPRRANTIWQHSGPRGLARICAIAIIAPSSIACQLIGGIQERPFEIVESNDGGPPRDGDDPDAVVGEDGEDGAERIDASVFDAPASDVTAADGPSDSNAATNDAEAGSVQPDVKIDADNPGPHVGTVAFSTVSAGLRRTCGVKTTGEILCWGDPIPIIPAGTFLKVSVGGDHACAIEPGNSVVCWGNNARGQATAPAGAFKEITTGDAHSCAQSAVDGSVVCWGDNQLGQSAKPPSLYRQVSAGGNRTCLLGFDGAARCQGEGAPNQPPIAGKFRRISTAGSIGCGIADVTTDIACWNNSGSPLPLKVVGDFNLQLGTGASHVCGVEVGGVVKCAGSDTFGESTPPPGTFSEVSAGFGHTCAVRLDRMVVCWGDNGHGQAQPP